MQTEREKANAVDMHTTFQQELVKLRLATAKAYLQVLTDGQVWLYLTQDTMVCMWYCMIWRGMLPCSMLCYATLCFEFVSCCTDHVVSYCIELYDALYSVLVTVVCGKCSCSAATVHSYPHHAGSFPLTVCSALRAHHHAL